jgi:NAD(P)-dependent dehydrogenase (short-subunit alcohol dehydrogenase family)
MPPATKGSAIRRRCEGKRDAFDRIINVNLRGVWHCMKAELRQMMAQRSGVIVNCASIGGMVGSKGRSACSASKHAVIGLTRSAALEYAAQGIRMNYVHDYRQTTSNGPAGTYKQKITFLSNAMDGDHWPKIDKKTPIKNPPVSGPPSYRIGHCHRRRDTASWAAS